jgi:hypothetical protein
MSDSAAQKPATRGRERAFRVPQDAHVQERRGAWRFVSRVRWRNPDGARGSWESRVARRRGYVEVAVDGVVQRVHTRPRHTVRLIRCNAIAATSFILGGALFALGGMLAQFAAAGPTAINLVFLVGGCFFSLGGYASIVQEVNAPRGVGPDGRLEEAPWRWWAYEPLRPGWVSAFALFVGTLAFFDSLVRAFLVNLSPGQEDRLLWAPEMVGCILFLISGHVAIAELCHGRFRWLPASLGWWVVTVNQLGSILFFVSGVAGYVGHTTGAAINDSIINWGTALGAACFTAAGVLQLFERPAVPSAQRLPDPPHP